MGSCNDMMLYGASPVTIPAVTRVHLLPVGKPLLKDNELLLRIRHMMKMSTIFIRKHVCLEVPLFYDYDGKSVVGSSEMTKSSKAAPRGAKSTQDGDFINGDVVSPTNRGDTLQGTIIGRVPPLLNGLLRDKDIYKEIHEDGCSSSFSTGHGAATANEIFVAHVALPPEKSYHYENVKFNSGTHSTCFDSDSDTVSQDNSLLKFYRTQCLAELSPPSSTDYALYAIVECEPCSGRLDENTVIFTFGHPLEPLEKIHLLKTSMGVPAATSNLSGEEGNCMKEPFCENQILRSTFTFGKEISSLFPFSWPQRKQAKHCLNDVIALDDINSDAYCNKTSASTSEKNAKEFGERESSFGFRGSECEQDWQGCNIKPFHSENGIEQVSQQNAHLVRRRTMQNPKASQSPKNIQQNCHHCMSLSRAKKDACLHKRASTDELDLNKPSRGCENDCKSYDPSSFLRQVSPRASSKGNLENSQRTVTIKRSHGLWLFGFGEHYNRGELSHESPVKHIMVKDSAKNSPEILASMASVSPQKEYFSTTIMTPQFCDMRSRHKTTKSLSYHTDIPNTMDAENTYPICHDTGNVDSRGNSDVQQLPSIQSNGKGEEKSEDRSSVSYPNKEFQNKARESNGLKIGRSTANAACFGRNQLPEMTVFYPGGVIDMSGTIFIVQETIPGNRPGLQGHNTEVLIDEDPFEDYNRVHIVPYEDTLPSIYDYDIFKDYLLPFLKSNRWRIFTLEDTFSYGGVRFKVTATDPCHGCRGGRIGPETTIHTEGTIRRDITEVLPREVLYNILRLPPEARVPAMISTLSQQDTEALVHSWYERRASGEGQIEQTTATRNADLLREVENAAVPFNLKRHHEVLSSTKYKGNGTTDEAAVERIENPEQDTGESSSLGYGNICVTEAKFPGDTSHAFSVPTENRTLTNQGGYHAPESPHLPETTTGGLQPTTKKEDASNIKPENSPICTVCTLPITEGQKYSYFSCKHSFHWKCVEYWIKCNHTCPNCREDLRYMFLDYTENAQSSRSEL